MKAILMTVVLTVAAAAAFGADANASPKIAFTVDATGLPGQIAIRADAGELPLEMRENRARLAEAVLATIGRGNQLRGPMRIEATIGGKRVAATAAAGVAKPGLADANAIYTTKLKAGTLDIDLTSRYDAASGAITLTVTCAPGADIEALDLVADLVGTIDLAVVAPDLKGKSAPATTADVSLPPGGEGIIWDSTKVGDVYGGRGAAVSSVFIGSGDRGLRWFDARAVLLERDKAGLVSCRIPLSAKGPSQVKASLRCVVHPVRAKEDGFRRLQWVEWSKIAPTAESDTAVATEPNNRGGVLTANGTSMEKDQVATHAISAVRYLAAPFTGLTVRMRSNAASLITPGDEPRVDRCVIGRALLHDIGVDANGVAQSVPFARLVGILSDFGVFENEGTEFLPYWRSRGVVRYGEEFKADAFEATLSNPYANVYVSAYRRAMPKGGFKVLLIVQNETDRDVRSRLHILQPQRLFGGPACTLTADAIGARSPKVEVPADELLKHVNSGEFSVRGKNTALWDQELGDQVIHAVNSTRVVTGEIYGPLHVPAHSFRILYGECDPAAAGGREGAAPKKK